MTAPRKNKRNSFPLDKWYPYGIAVLIGFCAADLVILAYRDLMLPQGAPPAGARQASAPRMYSPGQYSPVVSRNIFSEDGTMPEAFTAQKSKEEEENIPAVLSQLPLNLIGTMVFSNPEKSLAAIEVKGKNLVVSLSPGKQIENMIEVELVERHRVTFRNMNNGRREYIEMKNENKVSFGAAKTASAAPGKEVQATGENEFTVKRSDLAKYTNDLSSIIMQARTTPYRAPGTGEILGYRLLDFQPGSIFEQLGLQKMDIIKGANGTPVDSPAKAMEMFMALKDGADSISIMIERNGKTQENKYNITK